jgi:hypothetical protein
MWTTQDHVDYPRSCWASGSTHGTGSEETLIHLADMLDEDHSGCPVLAGAKPSFKVREATSRETHGDLVLVVLPRCHGATNASDPLPTKAWLCCEYYVYICVE